MTIVECIKAVLSESGSAMTSKEIYDRIIESKLYSFRAQDPVGVVNAQIRRHCLGLDFPTSFPVKHFEIARPVTKPVKYQLLSKDITSIAIPSTNGDDSEKLPEEVMKDAFSHHVELIKSTIYEQIIKNSPDFFEHLVVDLLLKMGYGYDMSSGIVTGRSHDGGIDGIISEDKLGLGLIYIQAKRYDPSKKVTVGRKDIQAFIGAMEHIQRGVFITTSSFTKGALEFAEKQQQKNIKLIDGEALADLLIKYEIGLQPVHNYTIYKIDSDYYCSL